METQIKSDIPENLPDEKNGYMENIKKRRSSIRRSVNGGFSSTLRGKETSFSCRFSDHWINIFLKISTAACSAVSSLPPEEKKRRITELCVNQTLADFKNSAEVEDYDLVFLFEEGLRSRLENVLKKIETSEADTVQREETQTRKYINQIKEEGEGWKAEFKKRRDCFNETRQKYKITVKSQPQIGEDQRSKLRSEDLKFIQDLPDFQKWNDKSNNLFNRHSIGLIHLEKCCLQVQHALLNEQELDKAQNRIAPTFDWDQWTRNSLYKTFLWIQDCTLWSLTQAFCKQVK